MHVTLVGAGALGRVYGVRLAASGTDVAFVVRPSRLAEASPFVIEQVTGPKRHDRLDAPERVAEVPRDTDAVLVTVRFDQLGPDLRDRLRSAPAVPIAILTPLLPAEYAALRSAIGGRVIAAMPGVSGYVDERDVVRYWVVSVVSTLLDDPGEAAAGLRAALEALARELHKAHLPARLERDVGSSNAATTTAFFPLIASIDVGGGIDGLLADKDLLSAAVDAAKECDALAGRIGKVASWAGLLTKFVGPFTLKPGVSFAKLVFPEAVRFVEAHFGAKLHAQHLAMGEAILAVGRAHDADMPALERVMARLRARAD